MNMANAAVYQPETEVFTGSALPDVPAEFRSAPFICQAPEFAQDAESERPLIAEDPKLFRGALVAFGMEVMAGTLLYGAWELWHLFR
jgi:hypothetical protein